jgi:hypothetical protein
MTQPFQFTDALLDEAVSASIDHTLEGNNIYEAISVAINFIGSSRGPDLDRLESQHISHGSLNKAVAVLRFDLAMDIMEELEECVGEANAKRFPFSAGTYIPHGW